MEYEKSNNYSKAEFRSVLLTNNIVQKGYSLRNRLDYLNGVLISLREIALDSSITTMDNDVSIYIYRACIAQYAKVALYAATLKRDLCLYDLLEEVCDALYTSYAKSPSVALSAFASNYLRIYTDMLFKDSFLFNEKEYRDLIERYRQYKKKTKQESHQTIAPRVNDSFSILDWCLSKRKRKSSKAQLRRAKQKRREYMSVYNKGEYVTGLKAFTAKYVKEHYTGIPKSTLYRSRALLQNEMAQLQQQKSKCDPKSSIYDGLCKALTERENKLFLLEADADSYRNIVKEATAKYRVLWNKKKNIVPKEEAVIRSFVLNSKKILNPALSRKELFSQYINTMFPKPIMTKKYNLGYRKIQLEKRLDILKTVLQSKEIETLGIAKSTLSELFGIQSLLICNLDAITKALRRFDLEYKEAKKQFDLATAKGMGAVQTLIEQASPVSLDYFPRVKFIRKTTDANIALSALFNLVLPSSQERNEAIELFSAE